MNVSVNTHRGVYQNHETCDHVPPSLRFVVQEIERFAYRTTVRGLRTRGAEPPS